MIRWSCALLICLAVLSTSGCRDLMGLILRGYTGPLPAQADITDEAVILRKIYISDQGVISVLRADRVRFLNKDPHDVNRLVSIIPRDLQPVVEQLRLQVGDTLRVTTRFHAIVEESGPSGAPDWPYEKYFDYPTGSHLLTKVERVGR